MKYFGFWLKLCLFNFFVVAVLGVAMRYNMAFSIPGINHKFMQESHSHFAFYGWVSAAIYLFAVKYLNENVDGVRLSKYQFLMIFNQIGSYGMLVSFLYKGYFWLSIVFSSIALFSGFAYFIFLLIDTRSNKNPEIIWLKSGAFFAVLSAAGIFGLAYFSSKKDEFEVLFRASTYFYLHYQYNGFFLFSCIGLFLISLPPQGITIPAKLNRNLFYLLFAGCFLGYGLSVLWIDMNRFLYIFMVLISVIQLLGAVKLLVWIRRSKIFTHKNSIERWLAGAFGFAFLAKFMLQGLSVIPALGTLAFSNINVVIAYLHLVLLMGISLFLVWKIVQLPIIQKTEILKISVITLISGIVLNELLLAASGIFSVVFIPFLSLKYGLLFASVMIMVSVLVFLKSISISNH